MIDPRQYLLRVQDKREGNMALSVKNVTTNKMLQSLLNRVLNFDGVKLVGGKKHRKLSVGKRKLTIPSTPSDDERRVFLNFRTQLRKILISEGLATVSI